MPSSKSLPWARRAGLVLGFLLLFAAIALAWRQRDMLALALRSIEDMPAQQRLWLVAILLLTVVANVVLTGFLFSALMSRYGRVGLMEMQAVMASSTLLNLVPLRPGLLGRVAYHRMYNGVPMMDAAKVIAQAAALSALAAGYLALAISLRRLQAGAAIPLWAIAVLPLPALGLLCLVLKRSTAMITLAAAIRYVDVLVMSLRYWTAFRLLGASIDVDGALAFACISMVAMMVPFLSNGLGLREWAIGLAAPLLTTHHMSLGITADLINRAAEIIIIVPTGLIGLAVLARRQTPRTKRD